MSPAVSVNKETLAMRHFIEELERLTNKLLEMSSLVESAIYRSVTAVVQKDERLARDVIRDEVRINQMEMEIDELAISLLASTSGRRRSSSDDGGAEDQHRP